MIMNSGKTLRSFRCGHLTSIGEVRASVRQIVADMRNDGLLPELDSFQLLRGELQYNL